MAGYEVGEGYWLPRGNVKLPSDLEEMLWPWLDEAETYILGFAKRPTDKPTALEFIRFLKFMRKVFFQDIAAMLYSIETASTPNASARLTHNLLANFSILSSPKFTLFKQSMAEAITKASKIENDPSTKVLDRCLPGINKRFELINNDIKRLCVAAEETTTSIEDTHMKTSENLTAIEYRLNEMAKKRQLAIVTALSDFFRRGITQQASELGNYANNAVTTPQANGIVPLPEPMQTTVDEFLETPPNETTADGCPVTRTPILSPQEPTTTMTTTTPADAPTTNITDVESPEGDSDSDKDNEFNLVSNKMLSFRVAGNTSTLSLEDVYCEFFGLEEWTGKPMDEGFYGLEKKYKSKWRASYSASEKNFFSRTQALLKGLCDKCGSSYGDWNESVRDQCKAWDAILKKKGVSGALRYLQRTGDIGKKGQRKRNNANVDS